MMNRRRFLSMAVSAPALAGARGSAQRVQPDGSRLTIVFLGGTLFKRLTGDSDGGYLAVHPRGRPTHEHLAFLVGPRDLQLPAGPGGGRLITLPPEYPLHLVHPAFRNPEDHTVYCFESTPIRVGPRGRPTRFAATQAISYTELMQGWTGPIGNWPNPDASLPAEVNSRFELWSGIISDGPALNPYAYLRTWKIRKTQNRPRTLSDVTIFRSFANPTLMVNEQNVPLRGREVTLYVLSGPTSAHADRWQVTDTATHPRILKTLYAETPNLANDTDLDLVANRKMTVVPLQLPHPCGTSVRAAMDNPTGPFLIPPHTEYCPNYCDGCPPPPP